MYTTEPGSPLPSSGVTHAGVTSLEAPADSERRSAARWLIADGGSGGGREASPGIAIANHGAATDATVTLPFEDGPEASAGFPLAAGGRLDRSLSARAFPAATGRRFSILVEGVDPAATLVIDRSITACGHWPRGAPARPSGDQAAVRRRRSALKLRPTPVTRARPPAFREPVSRRHSHWQAEVTDAPLPVLPMPFPLP